MLLSWMCLPDLFDMSQTVTSVGGLVPWRPCWVSCQTSSLVLSLNFTPRVRTYLCERSQKPSSSRGPRVSPTASIRLRVYHHPRPGPCRHGPRCTFMVRHLRCGVGCIGHAWNAHRDADSGIFPILEPSAHQMSPSGVPPHWRGRPALELMDGSGL